MQGRKWPWIAFGALVAAALGSTGYWMLFTTFMPYDDEGYVLWSARQYCEGHPLYTEVFSQYGPFFYAWYRVVHALTGLVFDSVSGRWLTLGYWLLAAGACGVATVRLTRDRLAGAAASVLTFAALHEMIREPFHPGGFLVALTALGALICLVAIERQASRLFALTAGLVGMAMALTKINVGAFFFIAAGSWMALNAGGQRCPRACLALIALGCLGAPLALMKTLWHEPWVAGLIVVFTASALSALGNLWTARRAEFPWPEWGWFAGAAALVVALCAVFCAATGTPVGQLWEAVLLAPLRHPTINIYPIFWGVGALACAALALLLSLLDQVPPWRSAWRPITLATLRLLGGLAVLWQLTGLGIDEPFHAVFQYAPALVWLMAVPLRAGESSAADRGRAWLAWCALWGILQAYPVAGSQMSWGCFLLVPVLVAGCHDAASFLGERWPRSRIAEGVAAALLAGLAVLTVCELGFNAQADFASREPLGLPGAQSLRLTAARTGELRVISRNAAAHAGLLFSSPGMLSFNIWSEKPTPTAANSTVWAVLLDRAQKQAIAQRLFAEKTSMIVARVTGGQIYGPPDFLAPFEPALHVGSYALLVWKGTTIFPLGTAPPGANG